MLVNLLFEEPVRYVAIVLIVVFSIVLHELGHAFAATWQGDPTPRMHGQVSLNPLKFMPPFALLLIAVVGIGFGATRVNPRNFRNRRWGNAIVSFAGPAVNLVLFGIAVVLAVLTGYFGVGTDGVTSGLTEFWFGVAALNLILFVLNMIPVPPLDGFTVADGTIGLGELGEGLKRMGMWPVIILIVLFSRVGIDTWIFEITTECIIGLRGLLP